MKVQMTVVLASLFAAVASATLEMPMIISHRGESKERPENSMAAYRLAFERGVDGVECDVYATTDGKGVLIHDATTGRTAGSANNLTVTSCSWDDLKNIAIGNFSPWAGGEYAGETIPLLDDYLALLSINSTTKCVIELKDSRADLIPVVVAAIQAQPLATKDRVIFISFETAQIAAIRTALPDYEAWLLLGSGTYSGATMVSKIQACHATGINVSIGATYTADDVATVKAAGFKFAAWTCDDADTAYSLVGKGVQVIATNTGKALKDALAPRIDEVLRWAEIYDPAQPRGAKLWDVGDYVQNGLVAHFDGIRNAGATQPHDSGAIKWKNLVDGQPDASFVLANANGGNWMANGYYFNGAGYAQVDAPGIAMGANCLDCTIQLATDIDYSIQPAGTSRWPNLFAFPNDFALFYNNNNSKGTRMNAITWKTEPYGESSNTLRPVLSGWGGKSLTAVLGTKKYLTQNASYATETNRGKRSEAILETRMTWGGSANTPSQRYSYGTFHAVRFYNRALSEAELAQNDKVDDIRYRSNGVNVVVESNVAGLEGTGGNGNYTVNGTYTFTAPESVELDGRTWAPIGYKVELWDGTKQTWDVIESEAASEFVYTNCPARAKVRLTWNWRLAQGVKRIDADDYVQAGLVHHFDGIRNAGLDQPHDGNATSWCNLASTRSNAARMTYNGDRPGAWHVKGYEFSGGEYFRIGAKIEIGRQATLQLACDYNDDAQCSTWPVMFASDEDRFCLYTQVGYSSSSSNDRGDRVNFKVDATTGFNGATRSLLQPWHGRIVNAVLDYNRTGLGQGASLDYKSGTFKTEAGRQSFGIGSTGADSTALGQRMFVGRIYAVRLYDRVLTQAELAHNLEVDNMRFFAGAGRSTETDLVEVTSELPIYKNDDFGCWIVRGAVEKTVTVPATIETANALYTCAGYRLETWNATSRMWENPQTVTDATSCTLQGTEGTANRRVTWLWSCTRALRTAADYDVYDYVQKGLVANYDGIRNRGVDMPHAKKGMGWRDLSFRDNLMVANANELHASWNDKGFVFNANGYVRMEEKIDLGLAHTEQGVMDVDVSVQPSGYPVYFAVFNDYSIFTRGKGNTLEWKYDNLGGGNSTSTRPTYSNWTGKYINSVISSTHMSLFEGTTIPTGKTRSQYQVCNGYRWALGSAGDMAKADMEIRRMKGCFMAARFYNRALSNDELALNRKVDEIRYRGAFPDYCNVEVSREQPFEGAEATSSVADGSYEVVGAWTFTASDYEYEQPKANSDQTVTRTLRPHYTISRLRDGQWTKPEYHGGNSYTYTAGSAPVKLVWSWTPRAGTLLIIR